MILGESTCINTAAVWVQCVQTWPNINETAAFGIVLSQNSIGDDFSGPFTRVFANMSVPVWAYLRLFTSSRKK